MACLEQKSTRPSEFKGVSCALANVARAAKPLDVAYVVCTAAHQRDDVVLMLPHFAEVGLTIPASVLLFLEKVVSLFARVRANSTKLLNAFPVSARDNFLRVLCKVCAPLCAYFLFVGLVMLPSVTSINWTIVLPPCVVLLCALILRSIKPRAVFFRMLTKFAKPHLAAFDARVIKNLAFTHVPIDARLASEIPLLT